MLINLITNKKKSSTYQIANINDLIILNTKNTNTFQFQYLINNILYIKQRKIYVSSKYKLSTLSSLVILFSFNYQSPTEHLRQFTSDRYVNNIHF